MRTLLVPIALVTACGEAPFVEVSGDFAGRDFTAVTGWWGESYIVFVNREIECLDMFWVNRSYDPGEAPLEEDTLAIQVSYDKDIEVSDGFYDVSGEAAVKIAYLLVEDGAFTTDQARTGQLEVEEREGDHDPVTGKLTDIAFDDGAVGGSFLVEWCQNMKP